MEDKKRNPILKYIGKPKISSQSSEYRHLLGLRFTTALLPEETCSHPPALGSPWPAAGTSQQLPCALLLQPPAGIPLSGPSVLPPGFEGSRKGSELSSPQNSSEITPSCGLPRPRSCWGGGEPPHVCPQPCVFPFLPFCFQFSCRQLTRSLPASFAAETQD